MELTNLPKEVRIIISEFNSDHRTTFAETLENIPGTVMLAFQNLLTSYDDDALDMIDELGEIINNLFLNESKSLFKYFNKCKCCSRHQVNKPITLAYFPQLPQSLRSYQDSQIEMLYNNNTDDYDEINNSLCKCKCRHFTRYMCLVCFPEDPDEVLDEEDHIDPYL
jgi:hypothetical protein